MKVKVGCWQICLAIIPKIYQKNISKMSTIAADEDALIFSNQRAKRAGWSGPKGQPACFGAGCYIEMATSSHQPGEFELVSG